MTDGPDTPGAPAVAPDQAAANGTAPAVEAANGSAPPEAESAAPAETESAGPAEAAHAHTAELTEAGGRFRVELPAYQGPLDGLVGLAQRGEIDLAEVQVSEITATYRRWLDAAEPKPEAREVADFLTLAGRLLTLKAQRLLPDGPIEADTAEEAEAETVDDPGARLAELAGLRDVLRSRRSLKFDELFHGVRSRLEAVATFLALLELLKSGSARVAQDEAFGDITVSLVD